MKNYYLILLLFFISATSSFSQINEGFEGSFPASGWEIANGGSSSNWEQNFSIGGYSTSNQSVFFDNFTSTVAPTWYVLRCPTLDLSGSTNPELTFDVAYARFDATHNDKLRLFFNNNNSGWNVFETYTNGTLTTAPDQTTYFTPTNTQWRTITVDLTDYIGLSHIRFAFEFNSDPDGGNVMYIDNVEITDTVLATSNENLIEFNLFPNPTTEKITINSIHNLTVDNIEIYNVLGQKFDTFKMSEIGNNSYELDLKSFSKGAYYITVKSANNITTKMIIVK